MRNKKPILIVEDDEIDAQTVARAFKEIGVSNPLEIAANGEEALLYLKERNHDACSLILLDLNMPRMNGIEFLKIVKAEPRWKQIPVVVLTTSQAKRDIAEAFGLHVAGYMVKPINFTEFLEMIRSIDAYWTRSELPE